jgi:hypothetical protein
VCLRVLLGACVQWLILSEETQLIACFVGFSTTVYKYAGGAIGKSFDDRQEAIIA